MIIETNHPPKMWEHLRDRQMRVNAGYAGRNKMFFLETSNPRFGLRALLALVKKGLVEIVSTTQGDVVCRLKDAMR